MPKRKSQSEYSKSLEKLLSAPVGNAVFGSISLHLIDKRSIRSYLDTYPSPVAANRQVAVLKAAWNWAIQRYSIPDNPAIGVTLNREAPRERRITQDEMLWVQRNAPPPIYQRRRMSGTCLRYPQHAREQKSETA